MKAIKGGRVKSTPIITLALVCAGLGPALGQVPIKIIEMAPRCWATHVIQGESVRVGTPSALIAQENAGYWRSKAAEQDTDRARLEASLAATLEKTRKDYGSQPGKGLMQIIFNASTCQTLRAELQPGYDPVKQNSVER
jgi:hypothetical protein